MPYSPIPIETFGGLNTRQDPTEVGLNGAVDMSNVELDHVGRLRTRDGWALAGNTGTSTFGPFGVYKNRLIAVRPAGVIQADPFSGTTVSSVSATAAVSWNAMVAFGTPTAARFYYVDGSATMRKLDGSTWSTVTLPTGAVPSVAAIYPTDNRMIVAGLDRIWFSKPDDPDTWNSTDFVDLDPGDGEAIAAAVTWRDLLIVFKQTKFFIFYGTSVDTDGGAIFNYRTVRNSVGTYTGGATAGRKGVYFFREDGVYLTTGEEPVLISGQLDWVLTPQSGTDIKPMMVFAHEQLHVIGSQQDTTILTYEERLDQWRQWDLSTLTLLNGIPAITAYSPNGGPFGGILFADTTTGKIALLSEAATDDNGTAIDWYYTTGLTDLNIPDRKVIREVSVWGEGDVTVQVASDGGSFDTGSTLTLATEVEGVQRIARRGTYFQIKVSGSGVARVDRIILKVRDAEEPK